MLSKLKNWLKKRFQSVSRIVKKLLKKKWLVVILIILSIIGLISVSSKGKQPKLNIVTIEKGNVVQEVSLTGTIRPTRNIDYAFDRSGRVAKIYVKTGDSVRQGETLISLDNSDVYAQYKQAQSALRIQQIKLETYYKGTRTEDLQVAQNQFNDAEQKLDTAYKNMYGTLFSDYSTINDLIKNDLVSTFTYIGDWQTTNPRYNSSFKTCYSTTSTNSPLILRYQYENVLNQWKQELDILTNDQYSIYSQSTKEKQYLDSAYALVNNLDNVIDPVNCTIYGGADKIQIDALKSTIDSAQASIESTKNTFLTAKSSLETLQLAYDNAKQSLEIKKNPYTTGDIQTQEALVAQAQSSVDSYASAYNKTILKAPFAGKITKIIPEIGDIVLANATVISLIGGDTYQIEVSVAESDISKVKVGNTAKITLDAYSSDIFFTATVIQVDLSATEIDGVATYKTILKLDKEDPRILPGMTANVDILSNKKENVLFVPSRAIITKNGKKFVNLIINEKNKTNETNITTGIRGSDGRTEVISGLTVGDKIISK